MKITIESDIDGEQIERKVYEKVTHLAMCGARELALNKMFSHVMGSKPEIFALIEYLKQIMHAGG